MRRAWLLLCAAGCLPQAAPVLGKLCDSDGTCPQGLACSSDGRCVKPFVCPSDDPAVVFCTGFEEGSKAIWNDMDGNPDSDNELKAEPGPIRRPDNHVGWLKEKAGSSGADLVKVLPASHDKLYARWFIKYPPGFDLSAPTSGSSLHAGDRSMLGWVGRPTGSDFFSVEAQYAHDPPSWFLTAWLPGMYQNCAGTPCTADTYPCARGAPTCSRPADLPMGPMPPQLTVDRWTCVEMMVDAGAPTPTADGAHGALALWVDEQPIGSFTGLWFRTVPDLKLTVLWLQLYHSTATHSLVGVYYDDVVISTQRVGCGTLP